MEYIKFIILYIIIYILYYIYYHFLLINHLLITTIIMHSKKNNSTDILNYNVEYISDSNSSEDIPILNTYFSDNSSNLSYKDNFDKLSNISSYNSISPDNSIILDKMDKNGQYHTNITKNKIFERPEYIKYNIMKNTYSNTKKYQINFNKIIFNIK